MHLKFDGILTVRSKEELDTMLDAAENNYYLRGEVFDPDKLNGLFQKVRTFDINVDPEFILKRIKSIKRVDPFFKTHAELIAEPISAILSMIKKSELFPTPCKIAQLALIPGRTIFYLVFLPKLLEDIIDFAVKEAMPPETEGQMAYLPNRSGNLCVAIGLNAVEQCDEVVVNAEWDQTKAFDSANWGAICCEYERQAGIGKFIWDYLQNRTYRFVYDVNGNSRTGFSKKPMGRGTWPGTIMGPTIFSTFQATNAAMNRSNPVWLWTGKFSDDCSPMARFSSVLNGDVQQQLDSIWEWKTANNIGFHVVGKKRPFYYIFRRAVCSNGGSRDVQLKFGEHVFDRAFQKRQLGVNIHLFKDDEQANEYGYRLEWEGKRPLSGLCYRLQDMKSVWTTEFMRTCVQAYVVGKLQFASSLYWLRASQASIGRARFDYTMAMAAVIGCNVAEIVGMFNCKSRRVSANCKNYQSLCKFLNLPTLETMAIKDARSLIRQWFIYEPTLFRYVDWTAGIDLPGISYVRVRNEDWDVCITGLTDTGKGLLADLFQLAQSKLVHPYSDYNKARYNGSLAKMTVGECRDLQPQWITALDIAREATQATNERLGLRPPSDAEVMNTFWLTCRERFKVLERYHRACKHLELTPKPERVTPPTIRPREDDSCCNTPVKKRRRLYNLTCESKTPWRRLTSNNEYLICWLCGYHIKQKKMVHFDCCDNEKVAHNICWRKQSSGGQPVICSNARHYFKRDAREPDYSVVFDRQAPKKRSRDEATLSRLDTNAAKLYCSVCDSMLDPSDPLTAGHLKFQCPAIPFTPLRPGFSESELARRLAALGSKKKLFKYNFKPP